MNLIAKMGWAGLLAFFATALAACGGGGGGGGGSTGIVYQGVGTPAALNEANAEEVAIGAYEGGQIGSSMDFLAGLQSHSGGNVLPSPHLQTLTKILQQSLSEMTTPGSTPVSKAATQSETLYGDCGGQAVMSMSSSQDNSFSGSMSFQEYCVGGATISGSIGLSGSFDENLGGQFTMTYDSLRMSAEGNQIALNGNMAWIISGSANTTNVTMNAVLLDEIEQRTYKFENLLLAMNAGAGYLDLTLSGRYFDPLNGYVDIVTLTPVRTYDFAASATEGALLFTGASNSQARLSFTPEGMYLVEVDPLGTGNFVAVPSS